jgi:hypothetical protein
MARVGEAGTAVIVLDVRPWPLDGGAWLTNTAKALTAAGLDAEAVSRLTATLVGARSFSLLQEGCVAALGRYYTVTGYEVKA